jgi:hypothetical protein
MTLAATRSPPIAGCTAGENLAVDPTDFQQSGRLKFVAVLKRGQGKEE